MKNQTAAAAVVLFCFHLWQFFDSGFLVDPLVRVIACGIYPFLIFFLPAAAIPFIFFIYSQILVYMNGSFYNYTAFMIAALCALWIPRKAKYFIFIYWINTVIVCLMHNKSVSHLLIHFINCNAIYLILKNITIKKFQFKKLKLTDSEIMILQELQQGKQQKEIKFYSQNTVCKKLHDARLRNDIATTEELLMRFILEYN